MPTITDKLTAEPACKILRSQADNILTGLSAGSGFPKTDFRIEMASDQPHVNYPIAGFTVIHTPTGAAIAVFPKSQHDIKKMTARPSTRRTHLGKEIDLQTLLTFDEKSSLASDYQESISFTWPKTDDWQKIGRDVWNRIFHQTYNLWYVVTRDLEKAKDQHSKEKATQDALTALGWTIRTAKDRDPVASKKGCPELTIEPNGKARLCYSESFDAVKFATFLGSLAEPA